VERAIKDLCQLTDADFLKEVSAGVSLIVESANRLDVAAQKLSKSDDYHAARILGNLAEEEAAKALILIDAIRCPSSKSAERARTLDYFYSHVAKGIYAEVTGLSPADFAEIVQYIDRARVECYLDGPTGADWIFENRITQHREDDLYVGYVREGNEEAERYWYQPVNDPIPPYWTPPAVRLVGALHQAGMTATKGLDAVAKIWRPVEIRPETTKSELEELNWHTLKTIESRGLLAVDDESGNLSIRNDWSFPLWPLCLRLKEVDRAKLRKIQENWSPDY
jgi:AbiV family abortive infection protein